MRSPILKRLESSSPLLMDGATGTELSRRGIDLNTPSWTAGVILDNPEVLWQIHRDYAEAGSELVTANTFRTHARSLESIGQSSSANDLTRRAVEIARDAVGEEVYVAGSIAPLEDCYSPQLTPHDHALRAEHAAMANSLATAGVDIILVETQLTIREGRIAAEAAASTGLPFCISFVCGPAGHLLSGESLLEAYLAVRPFEPAAFLINCIPVEEVLPDLTPILAQPGRFRVGAYANTGRLLPNGSWESTEGKLPAVYAGYAESWINAGLSLIGGCCGTTPEHISSIRNCI
ncbi:homocysteine S-methyltransferase family protein [Planctomicrobium sp. SH661]|uniref:homocysteine S-methyltransferase family protein n=1 Tax=Planctomicrobium sp. SH661 TaxID=3448124 RepID=UPI003F5B947A